MAIALFSGLRVRELPPNCHRPFSRADFTPTIETPTQLTSADRDGSANDESYGYDDNGNRIDGDFDAGENNQILTDGTYDYEYDYEGNIVLRTRISDGSYTEYAWDHRNRLVKVTNFDDEEVEFSRVEYTYDAADQLVGRKVFYNGSGTATEAGAFIYQNGQVVLQFDGGGNDDLLYGDLTHRYLWGPTVDFLLADEQIDFENEYLEGPIMWALADHLGTPRDWVDNDGDVVDHAIFDSYGNRTNETEFQADFSWTGRWRDPLTGLQWNRARWYNPEIQRWMSEDPIGFAGGTDNLSEYVGNAPTMYIDPSGLEIYGDGFPDGPPYLPYPIGVVPTPDQRPNPAPTKPTGPPTFPTLNAAALAWGERFNQSSINAKREYGSTFYQNPDGTFSYSYPNVTTGTESRVIPSFPPKGQTPVADIHSHAHYLSGTDNNFSTGDRQHAWERQKPSFLTTPNGCLRRLDPGVRPGGEDNRIISNKLPCDPNDPTSPKPTPTPTPGKPWYYFWYWF